MGIYDDAMAASIKRKNETKKRTVGDMSAIIDWLDFTEQMQGAIGDAPTGTGNEPGTGQSGVGAYPQGYGRGSYGPTQGGPSTGPIPQMDTWNFRGRSVTTAKGTKKYFKPFLRELADSGYDISSIGGYNYRNVRGGSRLSEHAYGDAIDINPSQNPMGSSLITNMPSNIGQIASNHNLVWGGNWRSKKDPMHFSISGY